MQPSNHEFAPGIKGYSAGNGSQRILWLHGYTMDSTLWFDLWSRLPQQTHFGLDLPGHGLSAALPANASMKAIGQQLVAIAARHEIDHVVAISFGALMGLQMVLEAPTQFLSVTLAAANFLGGPEDPHSAKHYRRLAQHLWQHGAGPELTRLWMSSPPDIFKGAVRSDGLHRQIAAVIDRHSWQEMRSFAFMKLTSENQAERLSELAASQTAGLILTGSADMAAFQQASSQLAAHWPRAVLHTMADAGHLPLLEKPEESAKLLAELWASAKETKLAPMEASA